MDLLFSLDDNNNNNINSSSRQEQEAGKKLELQAAKPSLSNLEGEIQERLLLLLASC